MKRADILSLIAAAFFALLASLTRYDGWFLVAAEGLILFLLYLKNKGLRGRYEARTILFSTLAGVGIVLWLLWDALILGDPFYFKNSQFSANSQQQGWLARGELPAYHNLPLSVAYYTVTSIANIGVVVSALAILGLLYFFYFARRSNLWWLLGLLFVPFVFYVLTLFIGQSVIFIPQLTPSSFEWRLFNVRYGVMMVPLAAVLVGYLFLKQRQIGKIMVAALLTAELFLFASGKQPIISLQDGVSGLSAIKFTDATIWLAKNYDRGLILLDDYARTVSVINTPIPMQQVIYIGNRPYWEESLREPEKYATWIVMQEHDSVWNAILANPAMEARLYKYFQKVYTSPEVLIFKRNTNVLADSLEK